MDQSIYQIYQLAPPSPPLELPPLHILSLFDLLTSKVKNMRATDRRAKSFKIKHFSSLNVFNTKIIYRVVELSQQQRQTTTIVEQRYQGATHKHEHEHEHNTNTNTI